MKKVGGADCALHFAVDTMAARTHCMLGDERVICLNLIGLDWSWSSNGYAIHCATEVANFPPVAPRVPIPPPWVCDKLLKQIKDLGPWVRVKLPKLNRITHVRAKSWTEQIEK